MPDELHHTGHRARLRARFLENPASLQDYEVLEMMLGLALPRRDVKPLAKSLLKQFGDLWSLVRAPAERLREAELTDGVIAALRGIGEIGARGLKAEVINKPVLTHWEQLISYCQAVMGPEREEQFRLLFLDHKNRLMADEIQNKGTINHTTAYPREIVKRALELGASSIILVHNHPSGDPTPSPQDVTLTKDVVAAAAALGISIHDHVIIGRTAHASLRGLGII